MGVTMFGATTELLQGVMDAAVGWGRSAEFGDVLADVAGAVVGAAWATRSAATKKDSAAP